MAEVHPWQQALWAQLTQRSQQAHAYLLHGPQGSGKRDFAQNFAWYLLCQNPAPLQRCGVCKGCLLLDAGTHPDLFNLEPAADKKTVGVDDVRQLIEFVNKTAQLGGRKVILIAEPPVEDMTLAASNALLKSLEEPAGNTVMLLISHQPSRLLPTIKSRCVLQACPLPSVAQSVTYIHDKLGLDEERTRELLALSGGSPLSAKEHFHTDILKQREQVVAGVKKILKQHVTATQLAEEWKTIPLLLLLDWFISWMQHTLAYQLTQAPEHLGLDDMAKVIEYLAGKSQSSTIIELHEWLLEQRQKVLGKGNLNAVLLLKALLIRWASLPRAR